MQCCLFACKISDDVHHDLQLSRTLRTLLSHSRDYYVIESLPAVEYVELYVHKHFFSLLMSQQPEDEHKLVSFRVCALI